MAPVAQAAIDQLRKRLGPPTAGWDAKHLAMAYFGGLEGTCGFRILQSQLQTICSEADKLRGHYENLPAKLRAERFDRRVPWLYGFELDFASVTSNKPTPKIAA